MRGRSAHWLAAWIGLAAALASLALTLAAPPAEAARGEARQATLSLQADTAEGLLAALNRVRSAHGLKPLRLARGLSASARSHARSMAQDGFFSHGSRDGTAAGTRIRRFYPGSVVGEVQLWRSPDVDADQALQMWLDSAPHRHVILLPAFREIGLAAVHASSAPGIYGGMDVTIVVADLGAR